MSRDNVLQVFYDEKLVGTLAMTAEYKTAFQYCEEWLENGLLNFQLMQMEKMQGKWNMIIHVVRKKVGLQ